MVDPDCKYSAGSCVYTVGREQQSLTVAKILHGWRKNIETEVKIFPPTMRRAIVYQ